MRYRSKLRSGVTLFEMMLVLALLAVVSALAWPAVQGTFEASRLRAAADEIRAAFSDARIEAMRTGIVHEFRYQKDGAGYQLKSWSSAAPAPTTGGAASAPAQDAAAIDGPSSSANLGQHTLPERITFAYGSQRLDERATTTAGASGQLAIEEGIYSSPILFYPDGSCVDAAVYLKNEKKQYIRITLRGLTGLSRMSEMLSADELTTIETPAP